MLLKILIIEDDIDLASGLKLYLQKDFSITTASSGAEGIEKFGKEKYNLVILDLKLPDRSGLDVCKALQETGEETPIIVLTGIADPEVQIDLLEAGADDYVTKPFEGRQLRARIDALLRRTGFTSKSMLRTHDLVIDSRKRLVKRNDVVIHLRRKEFEILEFLTRNKGQALTRTMIFDNVWKDKEWQPNSIDVHIKYLRDKVDRPFETPLIETVHGVGYLVKDLPVQ